MEDKKIPEPCSLHPDEAILHYCPHCGEIICREGISDQQLEHIRQSTKEPALENQRRIVLKDNSIKYCYAHPTSQAMGKCQECGKTICEECKQAYSHHHEGHVKYFCKNCRKDYKTKQVLLYICFSPVLLFGLLFAVLGGSF